MRKSGTTLNGEEIRHYRAAPLTTLDRVQGEGVDWVRVGTAEYLVGDAEDARRVLHNREGLYQAHSDFFHTRYGNFEPRAAQIQMRRDARQLLSNFIGGRTPAQRDAFAVSELGALSHWPDAGNWLAYRYLKPVLLAPDAPQNVQVLLDEIVQRAVLAGARDRQARWRRMLLRFKTNWVLSSLIEARRKAASEAPRDLLDVVARSEGTRGESDELVEVYLSFLFAVAGSVGFVLAWTLFAMREAVDQDLPGEWLVQEALRLWPVAWQLGRQPSRPHQLGEAAIETGDQVIVCPYLVQRNPDYWDDANSYRPDRWAQAEAWRNPAFIPFGYGPHRCVAAELSTRWIAGLVDGLRRMHRLEISSLGEQPTIAAALAPPPFTLKLVAR